MAAEREGRGILHRIKIILDQRSKRRVENELEDVGKKGGSKFAAALQRAGMRAIGALSAAFAAAFTVRAVAQFTQAMFRLGVDAEETASKFRTTFGRMARDVDDFIARWKSLAGTTQTAGRDMLSTLGAIVQGMGANEAQAATMAKQMATLAADLQAFYNTPLPEVLEAIQSGLIGSSQPMRRFGVVLMETEVQARALQMTGKKTAEELTNLERAGARLQLMLEGASVASGYAEAELGSVASMARRATSMFEEWREELATSLLPAFEALFRVITENDEGLQAMGETMAWLVRGSAGALLRVFAGIAEALSAMDRASATASQSGFMRGLREGLHGLTSPLDFWVDHEQWRRELDEWEAQVAADAARTAARAEALRRASRLMTEAVAAIESAPLGIREESAGAGGGSARPASGATGTGRPWDDPWLKRSQMWRARIAILEERWTNPDPEDLLLRGLGATGRELDDLVRGDPLGDVVRSLLPSRNRNWQRELDRLAAESAADLLDAISRIPDIRIRNEFADQLAAGIIGGIEDGFAMAFESGSIGKGFAQLSASLVGGLGAAMVDFGKASLITSTLMEKIKTALSSFLPGGGITASLAMIAVGTAMQTLAKQAQQSFSGSYAGGSYVGGATAGGTRVATSDRLTPVTHIYLDPFDPDNPVAVEAVGRMVESARDAGIVKVHSLSEARRSGLVSGRPTQRVA